MDWGISAQVGSGNPRARIIDRGSMFLRETVMAQRGPD